MLDKVHCCICRRWLDTAEPCLDIPVGLLINRVCLTCMDRILEVARLQNLAYDLDFYQSAIQRYYSDAMRGDLLDSGLLGLGGETGELLDLYKKSKYHGHEFDEDKAIKELGDVLFYLSTVATALQLPLRYVAVRNLNKLTTHYPSGKFTVEDSIIKKDANPET